MKRFFSHLPAWVEALAAGSSRQRQHPAKSHVLAVVMEIAERGVHHDHAGGGGGGDVDIVHADAGATDFRFLVIS